ncbi:hypothetical protein BX589_112192 [Paraburkholderia fungorum]|jgi:Nucleotide modification associated domain 2|uniref:Nmad2 family putative nucleotide modification protein n=2 Tax=Paraburkholderia fungorum TaxID=134537 RepID=UPI00046E8532|nr:hypothetical protein [Paraburkholderia fungorum]PRZ53019.1 hypothetical protein BX589_112192 [Paraburkholderia fungorum]PZR44288.1 MAG: hypothetical protein DI523_24815 [Paraburkholderia fungorum]
MSRVWRYVLRTDNGMAPCSEDGMLTLTCCKPIIRRYAKVGEWVVAFEPTALGGKVAYAGQVSAVLPLGDYEKRYRGRRDAIYRLEVLADGQTSLTPLLPEYHREADSRARDRSGVNGLIFGPFWYWGRDAVEAPGEIADLAYHHVGQSTKASSPAKIVLLEDWLYSMGRPGVHGSPRDPMPVEALERINENCGCQRKPKKARPLSRC